jgi:hypothetical protein
MSTNDNSIDLDDIKSNNSNYCLYCGRLILPNTDSGWEGFTKDGVTTQKICIFCELERANQPIIKLEDRCKNKAEWVISNEDPYQDTYSCTEHLPDMIFIDTTIIRKVFGEEKNELCCFIRNCISNE